MDVLFKLKMLQEITPKKYSFSLYFYKDCIDYFIYRNSKCYYQGSCEDINVALNDIETYYNRINLHEYNSSNQ